MELNFTDNKYDGPALEGYRSEVDAEDLERILISSREHIYSHPIQTLVQEYVNNAKDANRAAGKPDHAIDITAPTHYNLNFVCRDYGVGLTKDEIIQVYRKIGKSTKRTNNALAGKYGVGAKIGFVYTDAFLITSWKDGRKVECLAHKANSQIGDYTFLSDVETNEPNGVQISIKLKSSHHIQEFRDAIERMFFLWDEKPNINVRVDWPEVIYNDKNVKVVSNGTGMWLNVDGTPYKISEQMVKKCNLDIGFYTRSVYFYASLVDVDIPMNREELTTNDKLEKFLKDCKERVVESRKNILLKITSKEDYINLLDIKKHISDMSRFCNVGKIEIYAKLIDRKITYHLGSFQMEQKENDLFHHTVTTIDKEVDDRTKFSTCNVLVKRFSAATASKLRKYNRSSSMWSTPEGVEFPKDIYDFCGIIDYYDIFPKKEKDKKKQEREYKDIFYYDYNACRCSNIMKNFVEKYDISKPIYYSLIRNKYEKDSILRSRGYMYKADIGNKGHVLGFIQRNLNIVKKLGYTLICIDDGYTFSSDMYKYVKRDLFSDTLYYRSPVLHITSKLDPDINYIRSCYNEGKKPRRNISHDDTYIPDDIKKFIASEKEKLENALKNVNTKYPFIEQCKHIERIEPWISTYLIPLLLSNQKMEQNK